MLLANGFKPDPRVHKEALSLTRAGIRVTLICLDRECDLPAEEVIDGVHVVRLQSGLVKPGQPLSIGPALARFYFQTWRRARRLHHSAPFGLIHCHDMDTMPIGSLLSRRWKAPLVYDLHDFYSSYFRDPGLQWITQRMDRLFYRCSDRVIITHDTFASGIGARAETAIVMNVPPGAGAGPCELTDKGLFYAGNMESTRDMRWAIEGLAGCGMPVTFAGQGPLLEDYRRLDPTGAIDMPGWITPEEVTAITRRCLAVLALYDPSVPNNRISAPNKIFDAMKFGKPAIVSDHTAMAQVVRDSESGLPVKYGDVDALRDALERLQDPSLYERLSDNAYRAFRLHYNREAMEPVLLSLYQDLIEADDPSSAPE